METLSDSVRRRIREEMTRAKITQRDLASRLGWSQSRVGKFLTGHVTMTVDDCGAVCVALSLSAVEAVRDPGLEFVADLTPYELRLLERFRQVDPKLQEAVGVILQVKKPTTPQRFAKAPNGRARLPRPPITSPSAASAQ